MASHEREGHQLRCVVSLGCVRQQMIKPRFSRASYHRHSSEIHDHVAHRHLPQHPHGPTLQHPLPSYFSLWPQLNRTAGSYEALAAMHQKSRQDREKDEAAGILPSGVSGGAAGGTGGGAGASAVTAARSRRTRAKNEPCVLPHRLLHRVSAGNGCVGRTLMIADVPRPRKSGAPKLLHRASLASCALFGTTWTVSRVLYRVTVSPYLPETNNRTHGPHQIRGYRDGYSRASSFST